MFYYWRTQFVIYSYLQTGSKLKNRIFDTRALLFVFLFLGKGTAIALVLDRILADIQTKEMIMFNNHQQIVILISDGKVFFYSFFLSLVHLVLKP